MTQQLIALRDAPVVPLSMVAPHRWRARHAIVQELWPEQTRHVRLVRLRHLRAILFLPPMTLTADEIVVPALVIERSARLRAENRTLCVRTVTGYDLYEIEDGHLVANRHQTVPCNDAIPFGLEMLSRRERRRGTVRRSHPAWTSRAWSHALVVLCGGAALAVQLGPSTDHPASVMADHVVRDARGVRGVHTAPLEAALAALHALDPTATLQRLSLRGEHVALEASSSSPLSRLIADHRTYPGITTIIRSMPPGTHITISGGSP